MSNPYFQFKQFTVRHDLCAMKVGTDGTLLGAWTKCMNAKRILDVGCGSGLIALMLAQRCPASIDAIDIDEGAITQTGINIKASPFAERIHVWLESLQKLSERPLTYDLIVSNPPYYSTLSECPDQQRNIARHTATLSLHDLLNGSRKLLSPNGHLSLILPFEQRESLIQTAHSCSLFLYHETAVSSIYNNSPIRLLVDFSVEDCGNPTSDTLFIKNADHQFTDEFRALVKDFYLKL